MTKPVLPRVGMVVHSATIEFIVRRVDRHGYFYARARLYGAGWSNAWEISLTVEQFSRLVDCRIYEIVWTPPTGHERQAWLKAAERFRSAAEEIREAGHRKESPICGPDDKGYPEAAFVWCSPPLHDDLLVIVNSTEATYDRAAAICESLAYDGS